MINNNLNLSICRVKVNCQIRKFKITKLKQQVVPTHCHKCHTDSTDVIENDYIYPITKEVKVRGGKAPYMLHSNALKVMPIVPSLATFYDRERP
jgi:phosphoribosylaminoimidazole-succinocarboxamide synthase